IAIVFFVVRILVGILPGPIVFENDSIRIGDKVLVEFRGRTPLKDAREAAEKYLSEHFDSSAITNGNLVDPNQALFRGTATKGKEHRRFTLELKRSGPDAPWEVVRPK